MAALRDTSEDASGEFDIVSASDCNDVRVEAQTNSAVSDSDESLTTLTLQDAVNKLQELAKENMQLRGRCFATVVMRVSVLFCLRVRNQIKICKRFFDIYACKLVKS
jgi:hypothetical protein